MRPTKPKQLLQQTAEMSGYSLPVVTAVVQFFYSELSQAMSSCRGINITAQGLGTFRMNLKRTHKQKEKLQRQLNHAEYEISQKPDKEGKKIVRNEILKRIIEIENAIQLFDKQEKKRLELKQKRNQYEQEKVTV